MYHEQFVDRDARRYFTRLEWELDGFGVPRERIDAAVAGVTRAFDLDLRLSSSDVRPRMAIFVSKMSHCLYDIVGRWRSGEWPVEIPIVVSNHPDLADEVGRLGIPFHCLTVTPENKRQQEERQLELLREHRVELVVLARYMQILSPTFVAAFPHAIINIHHAFLPAFPGAKPYHAAHRRGVKLIGATSHYVTADLDAGPIIEQDVIRVSHVQSVEDLVRLGRDLEKVVLARAVWAHIQRKTLIHGGRTVIFP